MTRVEIRRRFDEIVAFAGVERFLDTPVKRYSSGMYVRLAFSIAAHLEPEILIVDEVLAVGDAEFQKKCLGKMHSVASKENRTVLFVSHNMQAVQSLCDRVLLLEEGRVTQNGSPRSVISAYLSASQTGTGVREWPAENAPQKDGVALTAVRLLADNGLPATLFDSDADIRVEFVFTLAHIPAATLCVGFDLFDSEGNTVFRTYQTDMPGDAWLKPRVGENVWRCTLPKGLLNGGNFYISPRIGMHNIAWLVHEDAVIQFQVRLRHGKSPLWDTIAEGSRPGQIAPIFDWSLRDSAGS
jgi:lipopolysaccharide transport system ATP-binding protein